MKTIDGDLVKMAKEGEFDVIVHGCNCFNLMGAGIAKTIKKEFPEAYQSDTIFRGIHSGVERDMLGKISVAGFMEKRIKGSFVVINAYTQYRPGPEADITRVKECFENIASYLKWFEGIRIGIPKIGCGIGGLDWEEVEPLIDSVMDGFDLTCVNFKYNKKG